jgi:hypothetical protein
MSRYHFVHLIQYITQYAINKQNVINIRAVAFTKSNALLATRHTVGQSGKI